MKYILGLIFLLAGLGQVEAGALERLDGRPVQGGLMLGKTLPGSVVTLDGAPLPVSEEGNFVFGFDRDRTGRVTLQIIAPDGSIDTQQIEIETRAFDIQRIDGLPPKYVSPPPEELERIRQESEQKKAARARETLQDWYATGFEWPARGRISGVYGSQRVYNGEPRNPHFGVDIAAPEGTPVTAPADGIVTLAESDMYFEGGLIFIDHGAGLTGVLMHLARVDVKAGDFVRKGDVVGAIGATGRATGAHLDWRMYWRNAHIDPELLVPPMREAAR